MATMNLIRMTKLLRSREWDFSAALSVARYVKRLQEAGTLPPAEAEIVPELGSPGQPVTVRELEEAGGIVRLVLYPL